MITGLPGATVMKPGSASLPFFGIVPAIVDEDGKELEGACEQGYLVSIMTSCSNTIVWNGHC